MSEVTEARIEEVWTEGIEPEIILCLQENRQSKNSWIEDDHQRDMTSMVARHLMWGKWSTIAEI